MSEALWQTVDDYLTDLLTLRTPALEACLQASEQAGLPAIAVAPNQGKLLQLWAQMCGARRILEIGTLGGYSTIWLAGALPADGRLVTLEFEPLHAQVAQANLTHAGLADRVQVIAGPAAESLEKLTVEGEAPFDFIFIDANKEAYDEYYEWAMALSKPGTVIIADNVIRNGAITNPDDEDIRVQGVRRFLEKVATDPRVSSTAIQTVGSKGYDGLAVVRVIT